MSTTLTSPAALNGINTAALQGTIEAVTANPAVGKTHWAVTSKWMGATRSDHTFQGCQISGKSVDRPFVVKSDEPLELCGSNQYPNPQEYLLASMNACMMVGYSAVAALMGIKLTKLEVRTTGDIDLQGFLGIDKSVSAGYDSLKQTVVIAGDATPEQFKQLHETIKATSPNFFNVTQAIPTRSELVVE